jgi:lipoprotein-anchoring transpeptidase ErfK/SrfK
MISIQNEPISATGRLVRPVLATLAALVVQFGTLGCVHIPLFEEKKTEDKEEASVQVEEPKPVLPMEPQEFPPAKAKRWEWQGDGRQVTHIWIDVDSQKARFYEGTEQVGWTYVASGLKSHPTPVGHFEVTGKEKTKQSNLYGKIYNAQGQVVVSDAKRGRHRVPEGGRFAGAKMPYFLRLTNDGVGLHAGPIPRPGRPASHGCIRMPEPLASRLFTQVKIGTPVTITGSGPDYGDYRSRLAAKGPTKQEPAEGGLVEPAGGGQPQLGTALVTEGNPAAPVRIQPATQVMRQPAAQPQAVQSRVTRAESVPTIKKEPATQPPAEPPQLQADQAAPTPNPPIVESDPAEAATESQTAEAPSVEPKAAQDQAHSAPVEQLIPATPQESAPPRPESPPLEEVQPAQADQDKAAPPAESAPDSAAQAEPTLKAPSQTGQDDTPAG